MYEKSQVECLAHNRYPKHGDFCDIYYYTSRFSTGTRAPREQVSCLNHVHYLASSTVSDT